MKYQITSFRHGEIILKNEENYKIVWEQLLSILDSISDDEIKREFATSTRKAKRIYKYTPS